MCRWLAYSGDAIYLEDVLFKPENSLIRQSMHARRTHVATNGDGFGVGWYGDRIQPGLYREVLPAWNDGNLRSISHQIRSTLFMAHVRASTGTPTSRENCHPFLHGRWMFMHNGQIGGFDRARRALEALLPDGLYAARHGSTDSELMALMLHAFEVGRDPCRALRRMVGEVLAAMPAGEGFRATAALADGETVYGLRFASDPEPPSLFWQTDDSHTLIVSEPLDSDASHGWSEVPPNHLLIAGRGAPVRLEPFALAR
jgi:glutamine amidotransferase